MRQIRAVAETAASAKTSAATTSGRAARRAVVSWEEERLAVSVAGLLSLPLTEASFRYSKAKSHRAGTPSELNRWSIAILRATWWFVNACPDVCRVSRSRKLVW
jgi:hypothetical protein